VGRREFGGEGVRSVEWWKMNIILLWSVREGD
jgi:hypothetical protein